MKNILRLKKADLIIFLLIIIINILPFLLIKKEYSKNDLKINIYQYNRLINTFELNKESESIFYEFEFYVNKSKYTGIIETKDSMVRLKRLPEEIVPKSIHSDISWIDTPNKIIVALPVSLIISLDGENDLENAEVDIISY